MADKLTHKQQSFIDGIFSGKTQSDAYRDAYDAENMTDKQIWEESCKLAATPKVSQRLFLYQQQAAERTLVTVQSLTEELNESRDKADKLDMPAAMTGATMGKAKLHGLDVQRVDANINGRLDTNWTVEIVKPDK